MKKVTLLSYAALLSLFVIVFASCSKDALSENKAKSSQANATKPGPSAQPDDNLEPGSIQAFIRPEYQSMAMYVYSDTYTSGDYLPNEDGIVTIDSLEPGTYTVVLHPYNDNSDMPEITLPDVEVLPGEITYLEKVPQ
jgi:hypothetical protein